MECRVIALEFLFYMATVSGSKCQQSEKSLIKNKVL